MMCSISFSEGKTKSFCLGTNSVVTIFLLTTNSFTKAFTSLKVIVLFNSFVWFNTYSALSIGLFSKKLFKQISTYSLLRIFVLSLNLFCASFKISSFALWNSDSKKPWLLALSTSPIRSLIPSFKSFFVKVAWIEKASLVVEIKKLPSCTEADKSSLLCSCVSLSKRLLSICNKSFVIYSSLKLFHDKRSSLGVISLFI